MKPTLQPLSAATGVAIALLAMSLLGAQVSHDAARVGLRELRIAGVPAPEDMVQIREGSPFMVPPNQLFVLTALGTSSCCFGGIHLRVNGVIEITATSDYQGTGSGEGGIGNGTTMKDVASGFTVPAGSTISLLGQNARAWGYLADA